MRKTNYLFFSKLNWIHFAVGRTQKVLIKFVSGNKKEKICYADIEWILVVLFVSRTDKNPKRNSSPKGN